jgi:hypothetical protein
MIKEKNLNSIVAFHIFNNQKIIFFIEFIDILSVIFNWFLLMLLCYVWSQKIKWIKINILNQNK